MSKNVLILTNSDGGLYNFRKELLETLITEGFKVFVSTPFGTKINLIKELGCIPKEVKINRHGTNPLEEIKLLKYYDKLMNEVKPDIVLTYTIKPNIYGGIIAKRYNIPYIANITGLGTAVENSGPLQKIAIQLYKQAFSDIQTVFFQNKENLKFFNHYNLAVGKHKLIPGSGVNINHFTPQDYPTSEKQIEFLFISRIMKEKGIDQYLEAAEYITQKYPYTQFHVAGAYEDDYKDKLEEYQSQKIIQYHGLVNDVRKILKRTHCTIHPTYYPEGMSNVLLESAASGRPIITTNRSGTREIVDDGINGYLIKERNTEDLIEKIEDFIQLSFKKKEKMGLNGRKKVEKEFDRQIVVNAYLDEIMNIGR